MLLDILSQSVGPQFNKLANYLMEMRLHLNDRVCYEAALQMFDQRCVKLSEVGQMCYELSWCRWAGSTPGPMDTRKNFCKAEA